MKIHLIVAVLFAFILNIKSVLAQKPESKPEVIYHVVQRSFYDSNGDQHGDFKGLMSKLDYLEDLGVTSILTLPTCESVYYHNYFSGDFEKIDPRFGTMEDWKQLVKEIHKRGMKIYLDLEFQYITEDHIWYKDSYGNPSSKFTDYLVYNEKGNKSPEDMIYNLKGLTGYDSVYRNITTINMKSPEVLKYFSKLLSFWVDPNGDKKFDDGVDGFRLDHMMDKLDGKQKFSNLFASFWNPLLTRLKKQNPALKNVAEQADWGSYGEDYFAKGGVDRVFAFQLRNAILSFNKDRISKVADTTFSRTPPGKQQILFLENHDMIRFASEIKSDPGKARVAAALSLLMGGVPTVYYGQELGMTGSGGFGKYGTTDANDIPMREAFEWVKADSGKGMAIWYKNTGPWWDETNLKPNDGISVEEQTKDPNSLLNTYRKILKVRQELPSLGTGKYGSLPNSNSNVFSFRRQSGNEWVVVVANLSDAIQKTQVDLGKGQFFKAKTLSPEYGTQKATLQPNQKLAIELSAYGVGIYKVR